ncbi:MAG: M23 family metallopeptidase [Candidatus Hydrogenedentes bacterium]|nr:M23 family metallopeptidase [Candidatus Hydrogenedentota bacterium]
MYVTSALVLAVLVGGNAGGEYGWPLDLPRLITSSFAEYRPGRLHTGIDLRTGDIGKDVRSPADGDVSRVRCSPWGYGKAVYLQLDDGHTVVFGHLSDFEPGLRDFVRQSQHAQQNYTVDLNPEPGQFRFKRGQRVAKSGQTGVGVPHLHYEIRDALGRPINPRLLGITWPDTTRPLVRKAAIIPAGPGSRVNGDILPIVLTPTAIGNGQFACPPVKVSGWVAIGADVIDPANGNGNILGVHTLSTWQSDKEVFRLVNDVLSYDRLDDGIVAFHPFLLDRGHFLLQWRWPGNRCESFQTDTGNGWVDIGRDSSPLRLVAQDFLGNTATVTIPIEADLPGPPPSPAQPTARSGQVQLECYGDWLALTAKFDGSESQFPNLSTDGPLPLEGGEFLRVNDSTFRAGYLPASDVAEFTLRVVHDRLKPFAQMVTVCRRGGPERTIPLGPVTAHVQPESPYGVLFLWEGPVPVDVLTPVRALGSVYSISPADSPIDQPVELTFPFPAGATRAERVDIYRHTVSGWARVETTRTAQRLTISTRRLGSFMAMEDDKAPIFSDIHPSESHVSVLRPRVSATVTDAGSGITDITATANNRWLLMEYDPERNLVEWARDEDLPRGPVKLVFRVTDSAGNATVESRQVQVGEPKPSKGPKTGHK